MMLAASLGAQTPASQTTTLQPQTTTPAGPGVTGWMCPMHPDVMTGAPGKCPRCSMDLVPGSPLALPDFEMRVETTPRLLKAGQPTTFTLSAHHPLTGERAKDFAVVHDKLLHLFVISRDLEHFAHIHPERHADGTFTIQHTLPAPGRYKLFADFLPIGGGAQITGYPIATVGVDTDLTASQAKLVPDATFEKMVGGVKVQITNDRATILGGEEVDLVFKFTNASSDAPITDLERYLGAFGHLVILSEDMTEYVHAHPREESQPDPSAPHTGGPEVIYDALLPKPGLYRAWLQFQRDGKLSTVSFTFAAPKPS